MEDNDYLSWSDEKLGKYCKKIIQHLDTKKITGYEAITSAAAFFILTSIAQNGNIGELTMDLTDVTSEVHPESTNWRIVVTKTNNDEGTKN